MQYQDFQSFTKDQWLEHGLTLEEIEKADDRGFIKTHYGVDLYLDRKVLALNKK